MKVFIVLALVAVSQAAVILQHPAIADTGASTQYRSQDNFGNYAFGYDEGHLTGGTFRKETGDGFGNVAGSYGLRDADGRVRVVNYIADAAGFRADIKTNEPGVEPKDPAHTAINKAGLVVAPAHHAVAYAAPIAHSATIAHAAPIAPVAYAAPIAHSATISHAAPIAPVAYAAPIAHSATIAHAAPIAPVAYAAPHYGYAYHY